MIGSKIKISRESEMQIIIQELHTLGVYENVKNEPLESLGYHQLVHLLATKRAVRA